MHSRNALPDTPIQLDAPVLCRILENIFSNALRFARKSISIDFHLENTAKSTLIIKITDDGCGFPAELLNNGQDEPFLPKPREDGHMGMGLKISRLLCQKHGGTLKIENAEPHGAVVEVRLLV